MDDAVRISLLKKALPNFPGPLLNEWLVTYVADLVPEVTARGWKILRGRSILVWRTISWNMEKVDLIAIVNSRLNRESNDRIVEMERGYFEETNDYSQAIPDGKCRTLDVLKYLQANRVFPVRPVFLAELDGKLDIVDGNHRVLAFIRAMKMYPPAADPVQELWVGRFPEVN